MTALDRVLDPQRTAFSGDWAAASAELAALRAKADAYDKLMDHFAYVQYQAFGNVTVTTRYAFDAERKAGRDVP